MLIAKLKAAVAGKEFVPVKAEDIGVEAVDKYTLRISLAQQAPFFLGLLAHQVFRLVPRKVVEQYGNKWAQPEHIVTCGPFKMKVVEALRQDRARTRSDVLGRCDRKAGRDLLLSHNRQRYRR